MRVFLTTAVFAGMLLSAGAVQAAQVNLPPLGADIIAVSGGCGPGGFRAANGYCYPRRPVPPPRYRPCPPGFHPTPYGCRRNY